jgi:hypothetical protein
VPDNVLTQKGEGILFSCNAGSTEKLKLMIIGKLAKPRCLKNAGTFPWKYSINLNAQMASATVTQFLRQMQEWVLPTGRCGFL